MFTDVLFHTFKIFFRICFLCGCRIFFYILEKDIGNSGAKLLHIFCGGKNIIHKKFRFPVIPVSCIVTLNQITNLPHTPFNPQLRPFLLHPSVNQQFRILLKPVVLLFTRQIFQFFQIFIILSRSSAWIRRRSFLQDQCLIFPQYNRRIQLPVKLSYHFSNLCCRNGFLPDNRRHICSFRLFFPNTPPYHLLIIFITDQLTRTKIQRLLGVTSIRNHHLIDV